MPRTIASVPILRRPRDISILDRVYEHISLPPVVTAAIDTPEFQRLRGLKQLGASSFLYPGAIHTRFEHSIGVAHLARQFLNVIATKQPELFHSCSGGGSDKSVVAYHVECAMLAGLFHDVGHGPFSHLFEDVIATRCASPNQIPFCHEAMSQVLMLRVANRLQLDATMIQDVSALMAGGRGFKNAPFYKEIISNKRNGIDVDRLDYLIRDSLCCFGKATMDVRVNRLFNAARIIPVDDRTTTSVGGDARDYKIAFEQKMAVTIRDLFALRAKLHKSVYQHHVVKAVGHMIGDILYHAAGRGDTDGSNYLRVGGHTLQECASDPELFIKLGDWILDAIDASGPASTTAAPPPYDTDEPQGLVEARRLLHKLRTRELYTLSGCINVDPVRLPPDSKVPTAATIESQIIEALGQPGATTLQSGVAKLSAIRRSIIVEVVSINHGTGDKDPLQFVDFFNPKDEGNLDRCFSLKGSSPLLSPSVFEEKTIMVFSRERAHNSAISAAFDRWAKDEGLNKGLKDALYPGLAFHNPRSSQFFQTN